VLVTLLVFFGVVFAVNGVFLYTALSTYSGGVAEEPYRTGLHYNDRIAESERQEDLAWQTDLRWVAADHRLELKLSDSASNLLTGLRVTGTLGRPATQQDERRVQLVETRPGLYSVDAGALSAGTWVASLDVARTPGGRDDITYRIRRRLWVKP
jgi:nitrogen fixation protein FixH